MRRGTGALFFLVLLVAACLFSLGIMQQFSTGVTRTRRTLAGMAATDSACESALDEALVWFKGNVNALGDPAWRDEQLKSLQQQLVKNGSASAIEFEPAQSQRIQQALHSALKISRVRIEALPAEKPLAGALHETRGLLRFTATASFEGSIRSADQIGRAHV